MNTQMIISLPASSPSSSGVLKYWKYDVFLSFSGQDTRKNFTDHLYNALKREGIVTFRDDVKLEVGKSIRPELEKAIEESRISLVIFSRNYGMSTWCLDELVKIMECKERGQVVMPIFYDVYPSDVRKQRGSFEEAFSMHEQRFACDPNKVLTWRAAMTDVANISGWHSQNRLESELIENITKEISRRVSPIRFSGQEEGLVGMDSHIEKLRLHLSLESKDVRMIGICGMGGIGKTTIARAVYNWIYREFEVRIFLVDVREVSEKNGLVMVQKSLLCQAMAGNEITIWDVYHGIDMIKSRLFDKRVVLIIDDVSHFDQLEKLAGSKSWFGLGSRIIITSRDQSLMVRHGVSEVYNVDGLNRGDALQLFSLKAFKSMHPPKDYEEQSKKVLKYADGLPLALVVLGSFLAGKSVEEWSSAVKRLKDEPEKDILDRLRISFDGLREMEKKVFLDVACFYKGKEKDHFIKILESCGMSPVIGLRVLIDKSLVAISTDNRLWMHDLLQEMGQRIVKQESIDEPGKRSRIWEEQDAYHVFVNDTGTDRVEGIVLNIGNNDEDQQDLSSNKRLTKKQTCLNAKAFSKLRKLRLLKIHNVQISENFEYLSDELRYLEWEGYPLKSLPSTFQPHGIVELKLIYCRIEQLWHGIKYLEKLTSLDLSNSDELIKIPDLTGSPNLETLILESCTRLREIHPSIGLLRKLILLNLRDCRNLRSLPERIEMESLKTMILSGCSRLKKFPDVSENMKSLLELFLDGTDLENLPLSSKNLSNLVVLSMKNCRNLVGLPTSIHGLKCLQTLNLSGCCRLETVPENLSRVECLEELDISGTAITQPSSFIFRLSNLKFLSFRGCRRLPRKSWYWLSLLKWMQRGSIDSLPFCNLVLPDSVSSLLSLTRLDLSDCNLEEGAIPDDLGSLPSLLELDLSKNKFVTLPASISRLCKLEYLGLQKCKSLKSLPELPLKIQTVSTPDCTSLEKLPEPSNLCNSEDLTIECINCLSLVQHQSNNTMLFTLLKKYVQGISHSRPTFSIVFPGSEIPEWFGEQYEGSRLSLEVAPDVGNDSEWLGFALCCVFKVNYQPGESDTSMRMHWIMCQLTTDYTSIFPGPQVHFKEEDTGRVESEHVWLLYFSHRDYYLGDWEADEFKKFDFLFVKQETGLQIYKCGVRLVYERDVEAFNQAMKQQNGSIPQSFISKRRRDDEEIQYDHHPSNKRCRDLVNLFTT